MADLREHFQLIHGTDNKQKKNLYHIQKVNGFLRNFMSKIGTRQHKSNQKSKKKIVVIVVVVVDMIRAKKKKTAIV